MKKVKPDTCESDVIQEAHETRTLLQCAVGAGAIVAISIVTLYWYHFGGIEDSHERWGQFGDYFGGTLNPIFSFIGILAIVITLRLQIGQIKQAVADSNRQTKRADAMQFQTTFFQLMELQSKIVSGAVLSTGLGYSLTGQDAFRLILARINNIRNRRSDPAIMIYEEVYKRHEDLLGQYFRNFYHILHLVNISDVDERQYFADLLRAQLSTAEAILLFYNGLSQWGIGKAKPLIEKFGLLKTLPAGTMVPPELVEEYAREAYRKDFID